MKYMCMYLKTQEDGNETAHVGWRENILKGTTKLTQNQQMVGHKVKYMINLMFWHLPQIEILEG